MSKNVVDIKSGVDVAASSTKAVSQAINLAHPWDVSVHLLLTNAAKTNSITFKLQDSYDNGATWQDVGSESVATVTSKLVASATDVDATTNILTSATHGFVTGDAVIYRAHTAAIGGLVDATTYYVIYLTANTFKLATSYENALAGTAIDITSTGTGASQAFYAAVLAIRMIRDDATDLAQLPLEDLVRVVCVTGVGDTCTVSKVYYKQRW